MAKIKLSDTPIRWLDAGIYEIADFFPPAVRALQTTRAGGVSVGPYDSFNLAVHVGDDLMHVAANRSRLSGVLGAPVAWLNQVHGTQTVRINSLNPVGEPPTADASYTTMAQICPAVMTADCLPVLVSNASGRMVGAAHAGWRGLSQGVIEALLQSMANESNPSELHGWHIWLGPAIGEKAFEVGVDVVDAFGATQKDSRQYFQAQSKRPDRFFADLHGLAQSRIRAWAAARGLTGLCLRSDRVCVFSHSEEFFSFRREQTTGRMASIICTTGI